MIILVCLSGCQTSRSAVKNDEEVQSLRSIAGAVRGKPLTDEEVKGLSRQIKKDPQAQSALESIAGSVSGKELNVKYCPVDGQRYSAKLKDCPQHHVPLKEIDAR